MKKFRDYRPNQTYLLPPSMRDWLPEDHPVYHISEMVDKMDLSAIYGEYREERGYPPYDPKMMVKVLLYAYSKGIRSSRKIERALHEDVGFRVLSANQQPDFWTIAAFRRRHHKALGDLFLQTVRIAERAGLVKLRHVAVDGTKIKANASKHSAMSYGRMKTEVERLRKEIEEYLRQCDEVDAAEDKKYGKGSGWRLPEHLSTAKKRLEAIERAKKELEEEERRKQNDNDQGSPPEGGSPPGVPDDKDQRNFTDPESRIMLNSDKSFIQGYNAQAVVDADSKVIVAADLTNRCSDVQHLQGLVAQVERNTGRRPKEVSADAGYWSEANVRALEGRGIEVFIPPEKVKHSEWRTQGSPRGRIPSGLSVKDLMRRKLRTKRGRKRYKLRQTSVEPAFGTIKEPLGLRQFLLRGLAKARSEWLMICAVFNILKMFGAGVRLAAVS
jgi:transposase